MKKYDENKGVQSVEVGLCLFGHSQMNTPLDDPVAEKERLKKISQNADAKILEEMFGGEAGDGTGLGSFDHGSIHQ